MIFRRSIITSCAAALLAAFAGTASAQQAKEVKIGYALAINSHYGAAAQAWADSVEKATNNAFKFKQFPSSALGGERELIEGLQLGTVEAIIVSTGALSNFVPEVGVVDIPFLFRDTAHARKVLDGEFGQDLLTKFKKRGLIALAWGEQGFRHLSNNKHPVSKPEDLKGLKIRTMENKVHMEAFKAMGALPTPMNMNEVFTALQTGTVDGQENPIPVILANKLYTVQKYVTLDSHVYSPALLIINKGLWDKISAADKAAFNEAAKIALVANRKKVNDDEANGIDVMRKAGTEVITSVDNAAFQKAVASAYTSYNKEFGEANIKKIMDVK